MEQKQQTKHVFCRPKVAQEWSKRALRNKLQVVVVVHRPVFAVQTGGPEHQISGLVCVFFRHSSHKSHLEAHDRPKRLAQESCVDHWLNGERLEIWKP